MCCWIWFASILLKIFHISVHHGYRPEIFFFSCVSARFWHQDDFGLIKWVREDSLFLYCLESFQKEWHHLLFVRLLEFGCTPIWSSTFLVGRLLIAASTSALVMGLFRDSSSSWFSLGGVCNYPGVYSFLPGLLVYVHRVVCSNLWW